MLGHTHVYTKSKWQRINITYMSHSAVFACD